MNNTVAAASAAVEDHKAKPKPKRRKHGRRNRDRKAKSQSKGPPQTPTLKVTLRNMHQADRLGTVAAVGETVVRVLLDRANARLVGGADDGGDDNNATTLRLDENSLQKHIRAEQAAARERNEWEKEQARAHGEAVVVDKVTSEEVATDTEVMEAINNIESKTEEKLAATDDHTVANIVEGMEQLHVDQETKTASSAASKNTITTRVLYMVPPKKTRRRGEKPGCAYLILTAPPIEARPPPALPELPANSGSLEQYAQAAAAQAVVVHNIDYSKDVSQRRIMLQRALDALTKCAQDDAKAQQDLAGCVVEESPSAKTWREHAPGGRRDRFEGTVKDSADYKAFFEKSLQEEMDRKARPKPAPGGGVAGVGPAESNGGAPPVAAIVMHLRKKKEEEKKRKQSKNKRKSKDSSKKAGGKDKEVKPSRRNKKRGPLGKKGAGYTNAATG